VFLTGVQRDAFNRFENKCIHRFRRHKMQTAFADKSRGGDAVRGTFAAVAPVYSSDSDSVFVAVGSYSAPV
jgi:hypothetical protein